MPQTELDFAISNNEIGGIWLVIDIRRFIEQGQQTFSINQRLVYRAIYVTELIKRSIELRE